MSTHSTPPIAAARDRGDWSPASAGRRPPITASGTMPPRASPADALERVSRRLDFLIRDVRNGTRSHREHERHVEEGEAIAAEIRSTFRGNAPQTNPPLRQQGGRAVW